MEIYLQCEDGILPYDTFYINKILSIGHLQIFVYYQFY